MADTFASFGAKVAKFQATLSSDQMAHVVGKMAKDEALKAAQADLGSDGAFSGWRRQSPIPARTRYDILEPGKIGFRPASRRAARIWTTAEYGRNQAFGPQMVGPRLTKTNKVSKARTRRYNGRTEGKQTASDALEAIDKALPGTVDKQVTKAVRQFFS